VESFARPCKRTGATWRDFFQLLNVGEPERARVAGIAVKSPPTTEVHLKFFSRFAFCVAAMTTAGLAACGGDVITATPESLAGTYTAAVFTTTPAGGQPTDQLALGGFVNITLNEDRTTTGQMHVAATNGSPAFDASMAGTWSVIGTQVRFVQSADTFMNATVFTVAAASGVSGTSLIGDHTSGGTRVQVTLVKPAH
jgi:hypothetical protein